MVERRRATRQSDGMTHLEEELTKRLDRANELGRRVRRVTAKVQRELERTGEIAVSLRGVAKEE